MTDMINTPIPPIDGYDDDEAPSSRGAKYLKFDGATQTLWFLREDGSPADKGPHYAPDVWEEHVKWTEDKTVADRIRKQPGEVFPDVGRLNAECPKSEWREGFTGELEGPWKHTFNVGLVDIDDGTRYVASNSTIGMAIAYEELRDQVSFRRKVRGERVVPVVELSSKPMKTKKYGMKPRPHFEIVEWRVFGGSVVPAIAAPVTKMPPLTSREIIDDEIHDDLPTPMAKLEKLGKAHQPKGDSVKNVKEFKRPESMPTDPDDGFPAAWD